MKRFGFTLAETLITLGIIGVIATVTLPVLKSGVSTAQIGPKLAKAVSTFEQANEALLNDNEADSLTDYGLTPDSDLDDYSTDLSKFLKFTVLKNVEGYLPNSNVLISYLTKDGVLINIKRDGFSIPTSSSTLPAYKLIFRNVIIDINGASGPNSPGKDLFYFVWRNDGSLVPVGSTNWGAESKEYQENGEYHWSKRCPLSTKEKVDNATYCAGHIFENNLKILYKQ